MIAIVDYKAGNLTSVARALKRLGHSAVITANPDDIRHADRIIFPGVGRAGTSMQILNKSGLSDAIRSAVQNGSPLLGICLGTQIIFEYSKEDDTECIGLLPGSAVPFCLDTHKDSIGHSLKVPHMGWNSCSISTEHPVLKNVPPDSEFYFVHSFYPQPTDKSIIIATTRYGIEFPSIVGTANIIATQFHPEKSGEPGLQILADFCRWSGTVESC